MFVFYIYTIFACIESKNHRDLRWQLTYSSNTRKFTYFIEMQNVRLNLFREGDKTFFIVFVGDCYRVVALRRPIIIELRLCIWTLATFIHYSMCRKKIKWLILCARRNIWFDLEKCLNNERFGKFRDLLCCLYLA